MIPNLNQFQGQQLRDYVAQAIRDHDEYPEEVSLAPELTRMRILPFDCRVPGMVAIATQEGFNLKLLYPAPRPIPCDPQFQHADDILEPMLRRQLMRLHVQPAFWRDQAAIDGAAMDAPCTFPAGSCEAFASDDPDVYGARQTEWKRPGSDEW